MQRKIITLLVVLFVCGVAYSAEVQNYTYYHDGVIVCIPNQEYLDERHDVLKSQQLSRDKVEALKEWAKSQTCPFKAKQAIIVSSQFEKAV